MESTANEKVRDWPVRTRSILCLQHKVTRCMRLPCTGWFLLWVSLWRSWTCQWSGSPWALSGHGCCCSKTFNRASSTPRSSVSGSSSVVNTSWLALFCSYSFLTVLLSILSCEICCFFQKQILQDHGQRNRLSAYWWQVGLVVFGSSVLLIFDLSER